jgi:5-methylcytosine-specific restriction endonuclease McrA
VALRRPAGAEAVAVRAEPRKSKQRLRENPYRGRRGSAAYQRKARELKASPDGGVCWICGTEIDRTMAPELAQDPGYWTADHDPPLSRGGSLLVGLKPAHRGCNSAKGRAMQFEETPAGDPTEYTPRDGGGFTQTPRLDPADPGYIENSRDW